MSMKSTIEVRHAELEMAGDVIQHPNGSIEFELKSADGWIPEELVEKVANRSTNLPVYWRHRTPQKQQFGMYPMIGHVIASRTEGGAIFNRYLIGEDMLSDVQRDARDWVVKRWEEKRKVGASIGASFHEDDEGNKLAIYPFEYSITPDPACRTCVREMPEEKTADELQEDLDKLPEKAKAIEQEIAKQMADLEAQRAEVLKEKEAIAEKERSLKVDGDTKVAEL